MQQLLTLTMDKNHVRKTLSNKIVSSGAEVSSVGVCCPLSPAVLYLKWMLQHAPNHTPLWIPTSTSGKTSSARFSHFDTRTTQASSRLALRLQFCLNGVKCPWLPSSWQQKLQLNCCRILMKKEISVSKAGCRGQVSHTFECAYSEEKRPSWRQVGSQCA